MTTDHNEAMRLTEACKHGWLENVDPDKCSLDDLLALIRKQAAELDTLRARLAGIALLAHAGGAVGLSVEAAQTEIRRICLPHWDRSAAPQAIRTTIDTARKATP